MARTLPNGTVVPAGADQFAYEKQMAALGLTAGGVIIVADRAEMESVVAEMRTAGYPPTRASAREFFIEDRGVKVLHDGTTPRILEATKIEEYEPTYTGFDSRAAAGAFRFHVEAKGDRCDPTGVVLADKAFSAGSDYELFRLPPEVRPVKERKCGLGAGNKNLGYLYMYADGIVKFECFSAVRNAQFIFVETLGSWRREFTL